MRLKAVAAGTGLSMVLVYDRLIRSGYDPGLITATITDVDPGHTAKTRRLLKKLVSTRDHFIPDGNSHDPGIFVKTEDVLHMTPLSAAASVDRPYHILTLVGILEYFCGFTASTTEDHFGLPTIGEENEAVDLIRNVYAMTADSGALIANSYRFEIGARILEVFGKRFRYRDRNDLEALVQTAGFTTTGIVGSGLMYDVEIFRKPPASQEPATSG